ncbi:MAG TPA: PAS domain S-box protein [Candidatus Sulfotelmatobacter sp.]|nr:PAS domain S-box protein [Candidatus Sulfotelmatobacter sp.]
MRDIIGQLQIVVHLAQVIGLTAICLLGLQFAWNRCGDRLPARLGNVIYGSAFGVVGVLSMLAPTTIVPRTIIDMRMPMVALATLFIDPFAGVAAAAVQTLARWRLGGANMPAALFSLSVAFAVSAGFRLWHQQHRRPIGSASLALAGLIIGAVAVGSVLFLPDRHMMMDVAEHVTLPLVLIMPIAFAALGGVLRIVEQRRLLQRRLDESVRLFRIFYDRTPLMLLAADASGVISAVSDHWLQVMGYSREEVVARTRWNFLTPASAERLQRDYLPRIDNGETLSDVELHPRTRDGRTLTVRAWMTSYLDAQTNSRRYLVGAVDRTAQQAAEAELAEKQGQLNAIMDMAPAAIYLKNNERRYQLVNRCFEQWFDRPLAQVRGQVDEDFAPADSAKLARDTDLEVLRSGRTLQYQRPAYGIEKVVEHVLVTKFPVRDETGAIAGICGFILDVSELTRVQQTVQQRERELSAILDSAPAGVFLKDMHGRFVRVNRQWEIWTGITQAQAEGQSNEQLFGVMMAAPGDVSDQEVMETGEVIANERPAPPNNSGLEFVSVVKFPVRGDSSEIVGIGGIVSDITRRVRAENELRASETRFRALVENSNDVIVVADRDGILRFRGPTRAEGLGYGDEVLGTAPGIYLHPDDMPAFAAAKVDMLQETGRTARGVSRARHRDGSWRWIDWSQRNAFDIPGIEGIIINFRDITESRRLEEELQQAQKMEAIGRLAGGIAHDFNNILGAIAGFTELALSDLPAGSRVHSFVARIATASERAKDLVQQILSFSRRSPIERRPENLSRLVLEAQDFLRAALPPSTEIDIRIDAENIVARVNNTQIHQILLNLCQNASHALGGKSGRITICLDRIDIAAAEADYQALDPTSGAGKDGVPDRARIGAGALDRHQSYARLTVLDTGSGMAREVLERIFDPFFTTKARGRGTGLGLAVVHGIVMSHGGACQVVSVPGEGTSFTVYLPLTSAAVEPSSPPADASSLRGNERIMVIDDEEDLCDVLTEGLERLGYNVAAVSDPAMALEAFSDTPDEWDIAISDQIMPQIKGLTLCTRMKAIRPDFKFVLCTGYSDGTTEEKALEAGVDRFFLKPVSVNQLAAAIRAVLDQRN